MRFLSRLITKLHWLGSAPVWVRYLAAALIVTASYGVRWLLRDVYPYPYLLFIPSIIIVSLLFNGRTGMFASLLSAVFAASRLANDEQGLLLVDIMTILIFTLVGLFTAYAIEGLRTMMVELEIKNREVIAAQHELYQAQRLEAVGQAMAVLAHDFRNALMPIAGSIDILARRMDATPENTEMVQVLESALASGKKLVDDILVFSRRDEVSFGTYQIVPLLDDYVPLIRQGTSDKIRFETRFSRSLPPVRLEPELLRRALANLIGNAQDAMPRGGKVTVEAYMAQLPEADAKAADRGAAGDYVCLAVSDTGAGIPEEVLAKIFKPFFTTKPSGQGTGLGLAMVADFMRQAGGLVTATSAVGQGTTVRLYFQLAKDAA